MSSYSRSEDTQILNNNSDSQMIEIIKALPDFLNRFGTAYSSCISCGNNTEEDDGQGLNSLNNAESIMSKKVLKEICIKSIVPESRYLENLELDNNDDSYPFCLNCSSNTLSKMMDLYRQLQAIQEEFNELRCNVVSDIIQSFLSVHYAQKDDKNIRSMGTNVLNHWKSLAKRGFLTSLEAFNLSVETNGVSEGEIFDLNKVKTEIVDGEMSLSTQGVEPRELDDLSDLDDFSMGTRMTSGPEMEEEEVKNELSDYINDDSNTSYSSGYVVNRLPEEYDEDLEMVTTNHSFQSKHPRPKSSIKMPNKLRLCLERCTQISKQKKLVKKQQKSLENQISGQRQKTKPRASVVKALKAFKATFPKKRVHVRRKLPVEDKDMEGGKKSDNKNKSSSSKILMNPSLISKTSQQSKSRGKKNDKKKPEANTSHNSDLQEAYKPLEPPKKRGRRRKNQDIEELEVENIECKPKIDLEDLLLNLSPPDCPKLPYYLDSNDETFGSPQASSKKDDDDDDYVADCSDKEFSLEPHESKEKKPRKRKSKAKTSSDPDNPEKEKNTLPKRKKKVKVKKEGEDDASEKSDKAKRKRNNQPAQCFECGKVVISTYNLKLHMRTHSGEKPYSCPHCEMRFLKPPNLKAHLITHNRDKSKAYCCEVCGATFAYPQVLRSHKASQHQVFDHFYTIECKLCLKKYVTGTETKKHLKQIHCIIEKDISPWCVINCLACALNIQNMEIFNNHLRNESHLQNLKVYRNEQLSNTKPQPSSSNVEAEVSGSEALVSGDLLSGPEPKVSCSTSLISQTEISNDMSTQKLGTGFPQVWPRKCPKEECRLILLTEKNMVQHMKKCHRQRNHICEVCGKAFMENNHLRQHQIIHLDPGKKPFGCDECDESFNTKASLNRHKTKHTGEGLRNCLICHKVFNKIKVYRRHMCTLHPENYLKDEQHYCNCCFLTFRTNEELVEHLKKHEEFKCEQCGRIFEYKCELVRHIQTHDRPFRCVHCNKTRATERALQEHIQRRHTDNGRTREKNFECTLCGLKFYGNKWLQNHVSKVHFSRSKETHPTQEFQNDSSDEHQSSASESSDDNSDTPTQQIFTGQVQAQSKDKVPSYPDLFL